MWYIYQIQNLVNGKTYLGLRDYSRFNKQVRCLETSVVFLSIKAAAEAAQVDRECIAAAVKGKQKTARWIPLVLEFRRFP